MGEIPQWRVLAHIRYPRKACRHVCVNTFTQVNIPSRSVQTRSSKWGHVPSAKHHMSASECGKSHHRGVWMYVCQNGLHVGYIPSTGVLLAAFKWGISNQHAAWLDVYQNHLCVGHIPSTRGFVGFLRVGDILSAWRIAGSMSEPPPYGGTSHP